MKWEMVESSREMTGQCCEYPMKNGCLFSIVMRYKREQNISALQAGCLHCINSTSVICFIFIFGHTLLASFYSLAPQLFFLFQSLRRDVWTKLKSFGFLYLWANGRRDCQTMALSLAVCHREKVPSIGDYIWFGWIFFFVFFSFCNYRRTKK